MSVPVYENGSTTVLARDVLGIKTTPSFFLFRFGERLHFHSGAKEERLTYGRKNCFFFKFVRYAASSRRAAAAAAAVG